MSLSKPLLHIVCGLIGSGKSTLAAKLASTQSCVVLGEDALLATLYPGELNSLDDYSVRSRRLRAAIRPLVVSLLQERVTVVLDFPANTPGQRKWFRDLVDESGAEHVLHYLDIAPDTCRERLHRRNESGHHQFTVSDEQFDEIARYFVPPQEEEGFSVLRYEAYREPPQQLY